MATTYDPILEVRDVKDPLPTPRPGEAVVLEAVDGELEVLRSPFERSSWSYTRQQDIISLRRGAEAYKQSFYIDVSPHRLTTAMWVTDEVWTGDAFRPVARLAHLEYDCRIADPEAVVRLAIRDAAEFVHPMLHVGVQTTIRRGGGIYLSLGSYADRVAAHLGVELDLTFIKQRFGDATDAHERAQVAALDNFAIRLGTYVTDVGADGETEIAALVSDRFVLQRGGVTEPLGRGFPDTASPIPLSIYLSDEAAHESVQRAVEDLLETAGLHVTQREEPVVGSWFRQMWAKIGNLVKHPTVGQVATTGAQAIEDHFYHQQQAIVTATLMQNLAPLLNSLESTPDAVLRLHALLIVKIGGVVVVHQLTAAQQQKLNHAPHLAQEPHNILEALGLTHGTAMQEATAPDVRGVAAPPPNPTPSRGVGPSDN